MRKSLKSWRNPDCATRKHNKNYSIIKIRIYWTSLKYSHHNLEITNRTCLLLFLSVLQSDIRYQSYFQLPRMWKKAWKHSKDKQSKLPQNSRNFYVNKACAISAINPDLLSNGIDAASQIVRSIHALPSPYPNLQAKIIFSATHKNYLFWLEVDIYFAKCQV